MSNNEAARPKRKLILSRETVQMLDPRLDSILGQQSQSAQDSDNGTKKQADCDSTDKPPPRLVLEPQR
jgi:hypothetical protein